MLRLHHLDCIHSPAFRFLKKLTKNVLPLPSALAPLSPSRNSSAEHGDTHPHSQPLERLMWKDLSSQGTQDQSGQHNGTPLQKKRKDTVFDQLHPFCPSVLSSASLDSRAKPVHPRGSDGWRKIGGKGLVPK